MEKRHSEILRKNRIVLRKELKAERIASGLFAVAIFDQEDVNEVKACSSPERKAETLLELLPKCGPNAFPRFYELLKETQRHLAELLVPPSAPSSPSAGEINLKAACLRCQHVNFVGRTKFCKKVISYVNTGCHLVAVSGAPGYGKSEATIIIGHILENQGFIVLYLSLKEVTTLYEASVLILETLGITASTKPVLQLQQFLKSLSNKTVLILDNTENVQEKENTSFLEFLKKIGESANNLCTLVTTTFQVLTWPMCYPFHAEAIPLEPLNDEESLTLFKKYVLNMPIPSIQAKQLCKACMGIPLYLEIAASQVRNGIDIISLIQELESNPQQLLEKDGAHFECMKVFFSRLPGSLKEVLAHLAVFPTSFTLEEARLLFLNDNNAERANIPSKICQLMNYALVKHDPEKKTYQLHNVVQSVCKSRMDTVVLESYNKAVYTFIGWYLKFLQEINALFISNDGKDALDKYWLNKKNIIHALSLAIQHQHEPAIDVSTEVISLLAKCLNIQEFEKIYGGFTDIADAKKDMKRYTDCLTSLGFKSLCYHGKENSTKAFKFLVDAYNLQRFHHLPESEETAHCASKLGLCHTRQGNVKLGVQMIVWGIIIRKRLHARLGGAIREMLICGGYCDLAMAFYTNNNFKAAVKIWVTICLEGYRRIMNRHPFTASLLQYIGDAYHKLEDHPKAAYYKQQALDMRKHLLTTNHQDTARSFSSLAETLEKLGKPQEAVEMLQTTLRIQSKVLASPEDIWATKREIKRIQSTDHCRMMGRCSILGNRMTSSSEVLEMLSPL